MVSATLFSSATDLWSTPQATFDELNAEFNFTVDVCALPSNAKVPLFYSPADDGLKQQWRGVCWMNPPYGRAVGQWVEKAATEALLGATVVCLLPARTDTAWFQDWVLPFAEPRFIRGRLRFGGSSNPAPFPNVIAVFRPGLV